MSDTGITAINDKVKEESVFVAALRGELEKVIVGQRYLLDRLIIGLLANGHLLLEGVPGLAKTKQLAFAAERLAALRRDAQHGAPVPPFPQIDPRPIGIEADLLRAPGGIYAC